MPVALSKVPTPADVERFFNGAMAATGQGSSIPPQKHPLLQGWKQTKYTMRTSDGILILTDEWGLGHEGPGGRTQIFFLPTNAVPEEKILLWIMTYRGEYTEEGVVALQSVLQAHYHSNTPSFFGGRAPSQKDISKHPNIEYFNWQDPRYCGSFSSFSAQESIVKRGQDTFFTPLGKHEISGGWML